MHEVCNSTEGVLIKGVGKITRSRSAYDCRLTWLKLYTESEPWISVDSIKRSSSAYEVISPGLIDPSGSMESHRSHYNEEPIQRSIRKTGPGHMLTIEVAPIDTGYSQLGQPFSSNIRYANGNSPFSARV